MEKRSQRRRDTRAPLCIVLVVLLVVIVLVNPLRQGAMDDDDWAYALSVRHLLDTGQFEWHPWTGSNTVFHTYWGALFARLFGYSFSTLRVSTLCLAVLGLIAFYYLAKEHRLDDVQAGLLTLALLASPLVLRLSFSYMTDVPFLACLVIAQYLYTRAMRSHSQGLMLLGSVAASAAILTRQFGIALIGGLLFLWVLGKERRQQTFLFLTGLVLPAVAGLYQLFTAIQGPPWAAQLLEQAQSQYVANPAILLTQALWRPTAILQYLALYCLPIVFVGLLASLSSTVSTLAARRRKQLLAALMLAGLAMGALALIADGVGIGRPGFGLEQTLLLLAGASLSASSWWLLRSAGSDQEPRRALDRRRLWVDVLLLSAFALYIVAGMVYSRSPRHPSVLMPYLRWHFSELGHMGRLERGIVTLATAMGAVWLARLLALRGAGAAVWKDIPSRERLLDLVALFFLLEYLVCAVLGDAYILVFLPFTLIVLGRYLGDWLARHSRATALACLAMLVVYAFWTRGALAFSEACWQGGEFALSAGAQPTDIYGCWTWNCYYRFSDYVALVPNPTPGSLFDFSTNWLSAQREQAHYWVTETLDAPSDEQWDVLKVLPYRAGLLQEGRLYVVRRQGQAP